MTSPGGSSTLPNALPSDLEPQLRIESLTGLRMVAAFVVYLSHIQRPASLPHGLSVFFLSGYSGVTVFFVLSGFVLAWNYGDRLGHHMNAAELRSFFVARIARVYPVYLLALAWMVIPSATSHRSLPHIWWHIGAIQAWSGFHPTTGPSFNEAGWSVGVEFFLYACFPLLVLAFRPLRRSMLRLALAVVASVVFSGALLAWTIITHRDVQARGLATSAFRWLYGTPWTRLGDFALGMTAAYLVVLVSSARALPFGRIAQTIGLVAIVGLMSSSAVYGTAASWDFAYMVPVFMLIVGLALTGSTVLARALSTKTMLLLGESSYAFYLFHKPLLDLLQVTDSQFVGAWALTTALNLVVILCVAVGAHLLIETPLRRLIRRAFDPQFRARANA